MTYYVLKFTLAAAQNIQTVKKRLITL